MQVFFVMYLERSTVNFIIPETTYGSSGNRIRRLSNC